MSFPSARDLPNLGIEPVSPTLQADSLLSEQQILILLNPTCRCPASAGSRGYPQDEWRQREKTRETSLDRAKSSRERERKREREKESDQMGGAAESGRVWQCFIFYHGFYTLS